MYHSRAFIGHDSGKDKSYDIGEKKERKDDVAAECHQCSRSEIKCFSPLENVNSQKETEISS